MKNYLSFLLLVPALLLACKAPSEPETTQGKDRSDSLPVIEQNSEKFETKELRSLSLVGDFNGDGQRDSLSTGFYSADGKTYIEKIDMPKGLVWDSLMVWFDHQNIHTVLRWNQSGKDSIVFKNSFGLYCLINIGDLNGDGSDELALVNDRLDLSRLNQCLIYTVCEGKWTLMKTFGIREDAFDFIGDEQPVYKLISGYLEPRGKKWFFKDNSEEATETEAELGKMKELKIEGCKAK